MTITKIKYDLKQVTIREIKQKDDELEVISKDEPMNSFVTAFNEFAIHLCRIAEQASDSIIEVRGLTFSENDRNGEGLIITGLKQLSTGFKLLINTPITWEDAWTKAMTEDIELIREEAKKYLNGSRLYKQEELLFDQDFDKDPKVKQFEEAKAANNALMEEIEGKGSGTLPLKLKVKLKGGKS